MQLAGVSSGVAQDSRNLTQTLLNPVQSHKLLLIERIKFALTDTDTVTGKNTKQQQQHSIPITNLNATGMQKSTNKV